MVQIIVERNFFINLVVNLSFLCDFYHHKLKRTTSKWADSKLLIRDLTTSSPHYIMDHIHKAAIWPLSHAQGGNGVENKQTNKHTNTWLMLALCLSANI